MKNKFCIVWIMIAMLAMLGISGCASGEQNTGTATADVPQESENVKGIEPPKTDVSQEQAESEAEVAREQAQLVLNSLETVYVYAYPKMLEVHGDELFGMDIETYFSEFTKMMQTDDTLIPQDASLKDAMETIGFHLETKSFSMDNYSAGMSIEAEQAPAKMQEAIKNYDSAADGDNAYMEAAHKAYEGFGN